VLSGTREGGFCRHYHNWKGSCRQGRGGQYTTLCFNGSVGQPSPVKSSTRMTRRAFVQRELDIVLDGLGEDFEHRRGSCHDQVVNIPIRPRASQQGHRNEMWSMNCIVHQFMLCYGSSSRSDSIYFTLASPTLWRTRRPTAVTLLIRCPSIYEDKGLSPSPNILVIAKPKK
jgi:hypothetical protein